VELSYLLTLARTPIPEETHQCLAHLNSYSARLELAGISEDERLVMAWASFARALLASNEFIYID
jgi:hypothetical protein